RRCDKLQAPGQGYRTELFAAGSIGIRSAALLVGNAHVDAVPGIGNASEDVVLIVPQTCGWTVTEGVAVDNDLVVNIIQRRAGIDKPAAIDGHGITDPAGQQSSSGKTFLQARSGAQDKAAAGRGFKVAETHIQQPYHIHRAGLLRSEAPG